MGQHDTFTDLVTIEEQIKSLGDEELLDFWEETQHLQRLAEQGEVHLEVDYHPEYERLILIELQMRATRNSVK